MPSAPSTRKAITPLARSSPTISACHSQTQSTAPWCRSKTANWCTASWSKSTKTKYSSTLVTRAKASFWPASSASVTMSIRPKSSSLASRSKPWFSPRKTKKVACCCPRSVLSTSVLGAPSKRSKKPTAWSKVWSSKLSRAALSSTSAFAVSFLHRWSNCAESAILRRTSARSYRPRSSNSTRTATTSCSAAVRSWKRPRRNHETASSPT